MKYLLDTHTLIWFLKGDKQRMVNPMNILSAESFNCHIISICRVKDSPVGASCARDPSAKMSEKTEN